MSSSSALSAGSQGTSFSTLITSSSICSDDDFDISGIIDEGLAGNMDCYDSEKTQESHSGLLNAMVPRSTLEFNSHLSLLDSNWISNANSFDMSVHSQYVYRDVDTSPVIQDTNGSSINASAPQNVSYSSSFPAGLGSTSPTTNLQNIHNSSAQQLHKLILDPKHVSVPKNSRFFVIKSFNEQDVKASFLNKIWSSTEMGNNRLTKAFRNKDPNARIFLFFSVNGSGRFCGVAEMKSLVMELSKDEQSIWSENLRWRGKFKVQWIFVKDIPNHKFRHLRLSNNEFKPVTNSRDTQEVTMEIGNEMIDIFKQYRSQTSFLTL